MRSDSEKTMLYFIVEYLQKEHPQALDFYHDFKTVEKVKETQQAALLGEVQQLDGGLTKIDEFCQNPASQCGRFQQHTSPFLQVSRESVLSLRNLNKKTSERYLEVLNYFGEPKTTTISIFFCTIQQFVVLFEKTKFTLSKATARNAPKTSVPKTSSVSAIDRVIAELKSGEAFL